MNKKTLICEILTLTIIGLVLISGCVTEDGDRADGQNGNGEENGGGAEAANWTFEGLRLSGNILDIEILELPDGSYAMHACGLGKVAYSPDGLTWTLSEDNVIGEGSTIRRLSDGNYRAWWSVNKGAEVFDMLTAFSSDGYNWEKATMLTSSNMEDFYGALPAVVISPDGTYRMYYTRCGSETYTLPGKETAAHVRQIYSAHSSDGLFWEPDPGIRIDGAEEIDKGHASSNDVYIREDGKYEMLYTGEGGRGVSYAVSDDGLSWTRLGFTGFLGMDPIVTVFPDGVVRMYYDNYLIQSTDPNKDISKLPKTIDGRPPGIYSAIRGPIE